MSIITNFLKTTGVAELFDSPLSLIMIVISCFLLYLGIVKKYEPLLLIPIATGMLLAFTLSIDAFVISFFTTGPGVSNLSIMIYSMTRKGINPSINALSTIMFFSVLFLLIIVNTRLKDNKKQKKEW